MMMSIFKKWFKSASKDRVAAVEVDQIVVDNNKNRNSRNINEKSPTRRIKSNNTAVATTNNISKSKVPIVPNLDPSIRAKRLMKEFRELQKIQLEKIFTAELINDNLFEWHVKLHRIDPESALANDMKELNIPYVLLHMSFPDNFPFAPPFLRVVEPRIEKGFVMDGGAICMELLTPRGWASAYTIEAILMQFAASLVKGQGRICRKNKNTKEFTKKYAEDAFRSLVKTHEKYGWITPALTEG